MHFGAGRLGFGLVLPALENASSPYVILNRPSAVWTPVIDREKETQQHVGVKVRARSIPRVSLTVGCFSNAARASAPRGIGAIRARFAPKPREPGRVHDDPAPRGGTGASARAIEDAGGALPPTFHRHRHLSRHFDGTKRRLEGSPGKNRDRQRVSFLRKCQLARAAGAFFLPNAGTRTRRRSRERL